MKSPIIFLHGFTGSPTSFSPVSAFLPGHFFCSPVIYGHTGCPQEKSPWSFENEVDRLARIIKKRLHAFSTGLGILCGYSLGGRLALGLALTYPDLFQKLVLISSHAGLPEGKEKQARCEQDEKLACMLEEKGMDTFLDYWANIPLFASQQKLGADILAQQAHIRRQHKVQGLAACLRFLGLGRMPDYCSRLTEVEIPVVLLTGEQDQRYVQFWKKHGMSFYQSQMYILPETGHNLILEQPRQVARILEEIQ